MNYQHTIQIDNNRPTIKINDLEFLSLQDLLNTINVYPYIESLIEEFKEIHKKSNDLNDLVQNKYNGYWEEEGAETFFTVLGYDNGLDVSFNQGMIYIEDEYQYPEVPRVKLDITEFIQILESWRDILKSHFKN